MDCDGIPEPLNKYLMKLNQLTDCQCDFVTLRKSKAVHQMHSYPPYKDKKIFPSVRLVGEAANAKSKLRQSWQLTYGKAALCAKESIAVKHQPTTSTSTKETNF
eukprot:1628427-Ditylum_brightwellii.AAC.1